jgi:hypothetical protein
VSAEGAELIGQVHGVEREERGARGNSSATGVPGPRDTHTQRERERAGEVTGADRSAPAGRERESEHARKRGSAIDRRRERAGARPTWADLGRLGCFILFFFSGFSNSFSISFSIGFSNPNSN